MSEVDAYTDSALQQAAYLLIIVAETAIAVLGIVTLMNDRRDKSCTQSRSCRSGDLAPCLHGRGSERRVRLC